MSTFKYDTNGAVVVHINDCEFRLSSAHSRTASLRLSGCFQKFDRKFQTGTLSQTAEMLRLPKCYDNNVIYTIILSITYKLIPSPHIRMWKNISHTKLISELFHIHVCVNDI